LDSLTLTLGLGFTNEVCFFLGVLAQCSSVLPFLVLFGALIWSTSFSKTKTFELLLSLLFEVLGVGYACVLWFRLGFRNGFGRDSGVFGNFFLLVILRESFAGVFVISGICYGSTRSRITCPKRSVVG